MFGEVMYGGHIADEVDRSICNAYVAFFMK